MTDAELDEHIKTALAWPNLASQFDALQRLCRYHYRYVLKHPDVEKWALKNGKEIVARWARK